jgi:hypothetical protein
MEYSFLRHRVTSRKTAASIPSGIIVIIPWHVPSNRNVELLFLESRLFLTENQVLIYQLPDTKRLLLLVRMRIHLLHT